MDSRSLVRRGVTRRGDLPVGPLRQARPVGLPLRFFVEERQETRGRRKRQRRRVESRTSGNRNSLLCCSSHQAPKTPPCYLVRLSSLLQRTRKSEVS